MGWLFKVFNSLPLLSCSDADVDVVTDFNENSRKINSLYVHYSTVLYKILVWWPLLTSACRNWIACVRAGERQQILYYL